MAAQHNMDKFVLEFFQPELLGGRLGFFLEAGGSDPIDQNNTKLLEENGWKGLCVEPMVVYNDQYKKFRPNTIVKNYALVADSYSHPTIKGDFSVRHMSGIFNDPHRLQNNEVPAIPLSILLAQEHIMHVDFLSLDVEGYEFEVLSGIDFTKCFFKLIIVEYHTPTPDSIMHPNLLSHFSLLGEIPNEHHCIFINKNYTLNDHHKSVLLKYYNIG
jgi:FkbM family methyltransferase